MQLQLFVLAASPWLASAQVDTTTGNEATGPDYNYYLGIFALYAIAAATLALTSKLYHSDTRTDEITGPLQQTLKSSSILSWFCLTPTSVASPSDSPTASPSTNYSIRLAGCFFGLQLSYLSWGFLQERLMTVNYDGERFVHSEALVLINRLLACVIAIIVNKMRNTSSSFSPPYKYCICSMGNILSTWFQYEALKFVGFPLQVLSKSSKILFAMIMGKVVQGKSFKWSEYGVAAVIMVGLAIYKIYDVGKGGGVREHSQQIFGGLLLLCYVGFDSFTSNYQKTVFDTHKINPYQMMLGINAASCTVLFVMLGLRGVLMEAILFFLDHPLCLIHACLMSVCSASGQLFIFYTIKEFGVVVFSSIMTFRQFLAIMLSLVYYGHPVTAGSACGLATVFFALAFQISQKMKKST